MFIRKNKNRSGSISVQIISKSTGKYKVIKTIGCGGTEQEIQNLTYLANQEIERLSNQPKLFVSEKEIKYSLFWKTQASEQLAPKLFSARFTIA